MRTQVAIFTLFHLFSPSSTCFSFLPSRVLITNPQQYHTCGLVYRRNNSCAFHEATKHQNRQVLHEDENKREKSRRGSVENWWCVRSCEGIQISDVCDEQKRYSGNECARWYVIIIEVEYCSLLLKLFGKPVNSRRKPVVYCSLDRDCVRNISVRVCICLQIILHLGS